MLFTSAATANADEAAITEAGQLVYSQQYQLAYEILAPLESDQAGEPVYDYLLGIAALRSGKSGLALFPLERVIAIQPDYPGARFAIAEAYLNIGDIEAAKKEFKIAQQNGDVEQSDANQFQRELDRITIGLTQVGGSIGLELGYDDNVTSTTSDNIIRTPNVVVTLDDDANDIEEVFIRIKGSAWLQKPLSRKYNLLAGGGVLTRINESADEQEYTTLDARIGIGNRSKESKYAAYLFGTSLDRDSDSYQDSLGLLAQWRYKLGPDSHLSSFIRTAQLDYADQSDRDALLTLISVAYVRKLDSTRSPVFFAGISGGSNDPDSSSGDEFGYSLVALNSGIEFSLSDTLKPYAYAGYMKRDFDEEDSIFGTTREDDRLTIRLGVRIKQAADWTIKPELTYIDNDSNIPTNDYDRTMISVLLQRDFN